MSGSGNIFFFRCRILTAAPHGQKNVLHGIIPVQQNIRISVQGGEPCFVNVSRSFPDQTIQVKEMSDSILKEIPQAYREPCETAGRLEELKIPEFPNAVVYLPAGYDESACRYPVFYLLHGGGGDPYAFFGEDGIFKNMIDHMILSGELRPLIIVAPTYYPPGTKGNGIAYSGEAVREFGPVLLKTILPIVDGKYRTAAERESRAIGGFSMGAVATWFVLMAGTDSFHWYMPLSGDCWICGERGGGLHPKQTAALLETALKGCRFAIHVLTGDGDIAFPNVDPQVKAMKKIRDVFGKTLKYSVLPGGVHDYPDIRRYIYNALPGFFSASGQL